jgi:hypothetical protein
MRDRSAQRARRRKREEEAEAAALKDLQGDDVVRPASIDPASGGGKHADRVRDRKAARKQKKRLEQKAIRRVVRAAKEKDDALPRLNESAPLLDLSSEAGEPSSQQAGATGDEAEKLATGLTGVYGWNALAHGVGSSRDLLKLPPKRRFKRGAHSAEEDAREAAEREAAFRRRRDERAPAIVTGPGVRGSRRGAKVAVGGEGEKPDGEAALARALESSEQDEELAEAEREADALLREEPEWPRGEPAARAGVSDSEGAGEEAGLEGEEAEAEAVLDEHWNPALDDPYLDPVAAGPLSRVPARPRARVPARPRARAPPLTRARGAQGGGASRWSSSSGWSGRGRWRSRCAGTPARWRPGGSGRAPRCG